MSNAKAVSVSMVDLRTRAEEIVQAVQRGERLVLTYRGKPAIRLEPLERADASSDDVFYRLAERAEPRGRGRSLSNPEIDAILYGKADGE